MNRWRGIFDAQQEFDIILGPHKELPTEINRIVEDTVKHELTKSLISERVHPIDIGKESTSAIRNTTDMIYRAFNSPPMFSIISGQLTRKTLAAISTAFVRKPSDIAHIMLHSQVPDFSMLSWEDIVDLCHNSHYDYFRNSIRELQALRNQGSIEETGKLCNDIFTHSLKKLVQTTRTSSSSKNILEGIIGNSTPIGWLLSGRDTVSQKIIDKEYGWIYFVLDIEETVKRKKYNKIIHQTKNPCVFWDK
ncbi:hypothetical protein MHK_010598 [Candidatus Magnetomorum sp. HK-1]|nr:hypothetical protein MHK_010598 [Candidatus Magnetomorum sp. HK-1]